MAANRVHELFDRYLSRGLNQEEMIEWQSLLQKDDAESLLNDPLREVWDAQLKQTVNYPVDWETVYQSVTAIPAQHRIPAPTIFRRLAIAASVILIFSLGIIYWPLKEQPKTAVLLPHDKAAPGSNKATIRLADGSVLNLDNAANGLLGSQQNIRIVKLANGQIAYQMQDGTMSTEMQYNTLSNPRGSQVIDMTLSDGSRVWLNAGSSVTYPIAFTGHDRKVEINGEAYFEVAHDVSKPFIVAKGDMQVQVLGTHFNVDAYDDDAAIAVTLLEGSVRASNPVGGLTIEPGEQVTIAQNAKPQRAASVDLEEVMAWKNGRFQFKGAKLETIMREVARWYDMDVVMEKPVDVVFYAEVSRTTQVSRLLKILEATKAVKFRVAGRQIFVTQ